MISNKQIMIRSLMAFCSFYGQMTFAAGKGTAKQEVSQSHVGENDNLYVGTWRLSSFKTNRMLLTSICQKPVANRYADGETFDGNISITNGKRGIFITKVAENDCQWNLENSDITAPNSSILSFFFEPTDAKAMKITILNNFIESTPTADSRRILTLFTRTNPYTFYSRTIAYDIVNTTCTPTVEGVPGFRYDYMTCSDADKTVEFKFYRTSTVISNSLLRSADVAAP